MKKLFVIYLVFLMSISGCSTTPSTESSVDSTTDISSGTYTSTQTGRKGPVSVEVTIEENEIKSVGVTEHYESAIYSDAAIEVIPSEIVANQTTNVDTISGATFTSSAIIRGVRDCITQAGGTAESFATELTPPTPTDEVLNVDVVIVGGGAAGLMAGITAAEAGKSVVIIETLGYAGGNLLSAVGVIAGPGSKVQQEHGIEMTPESYLETKIERRDAATLTPYYDETPDRTLLFYQQNRIICDWISDRGIEYVEPPMGVSHTLAPGYYQGVSNFTYFLIDTFEQAGGQIYYETTGTELIVTDGAVTGVMATSKDKNYTINADSTIMATGGFTSNSEMVNEIYPDFSSMYSTAMVSNTGSGITMIESVGGTIEAMDAGIHKIPVTTVGKIDIPFFTIMSGAVLVNAQGERFTSESGNPPAMMELMISEHDGVGYFIFDESDKEALWSTFRTIFDLNAPIQYTSIEEAAEDLNMPELVETMTNYNEMATNGEDTQFGRFFNLHAIEGDTIYALAIEPGLYLTYGGVKTDDAMRVLDANDQAIPGLYAAGDIQGSTEVKEGFGYTAGVTHALSFGMIAAETVLEDSK